MRGSTPPRERDRVVRVVAHARLHFGQIDLHGGLGRRFGSIGVSIETPRVVVEARPSATLEVDGPDRARAARAALWFLESRRLAAVARVQVLESIPAHVGLGSGTQLMLATGLALAKLSGIDLTAETLARVMRRGDRSGVGTGTFSHGGFVVDAGVPTDDRSDESQIPPVIFHCPFPPSWWFVVAIPQVHRGLSGAQEERAFATAPPMVPEAVGEICRLLVMQTLPALLEEELRAFGASLTRIQAIVGDYFADMQGGRFSTALGTKLVTRMLKAGASGAGQSSWGPAVYGLVEGEGAARTLADHLKEETAQEDVVIFCTPAANTGATWTVSE